MTAHRMSETTTEPWTANRPDVLGVVGLGVMGAPMARHLAEASRVAAGSSAASEVSGTSTGSRGTGADRMATRGRGPVLVSTRTPESAAEAVAAGAERVADPAELGERCDLVLVMVPAMDDVVAVVGDPARYGHDYLGGEDGSAATLLTGRRRRVGARSDIADRLRPLVVAVGSTVSPQALRTYSAAVDEATDGDVLVIDTPVSGGAEGAQAGTLAIMVGAPEATDATEAADAAVATDAPEATGSAKPTEASGVARPTHRSGQDADHTSPSAAQRALTALAPCGTPRLLGPIGAGQVAKACNQLIVAATVVANAEAAVLAERAGLDVAGLFELLGGGYAGSRVMEVKARRFAEHDHSPSGPAKFMIKDLTAVLEEARASNVELVTAGPLLAAFTELTVQGRGDLDTAVVQAYLEERPSDS